MISVDEARALILDNTPVMATELVPLGSLASRVLAQPIGAPFDLPLFTASAVDGYAVRASDLAVSPSELKLVGSVAAGESPATDLDEGQTIRIFTGSPIPPGADAVVMQEDVEASGDKVVFHGATRPGKHVRSRAEELQKGAKVFDPGVLVNPGVLGVLSTLGITEAHAYKQPRIGVIGTGNELVEPGTELRPGQIYESNARSISTALSLAGCAPGEVRSCGDHIETIEQAIRRSLASDDAVITCGGVSVGAHDLVREAAKRVGVQEVFWRVSMKPGKPFYFGLSENGQPFFGLPGNPVSALVTFFVLVRPALRKMAGLDSVESEIPAVLGAPLVSELGRTEFVRASLTLVSNQLTATPTECQGSHMMTGLSLADGLIRVPAEAANLEAGELVLVIRLQWGLC